MNRLRIGCIGEAMIELSLGEEMKNPSLGFAGDVLNTAIYLRRHLDEVHEVSFVSAIGTDAFSASMAEFVASESILTGHLLRLESHVPGLYAITLDETGERSFTYWRENSAARQLFTPNTGPNFDTLAQFDVIYLSAITLAILSEQARSSLHDWLSSWRKTGGRLAFDSNYRPRLWADTQTAQDQVSKFWRITDIALPSLDDEMALFGDHNEAETMNRLSGYGLNLGALKRGHLGPRPIGECAGPLPDFKPAETVVDTTAAGDSFNGAYLACLLQGGKAEQALEAGHDCAAKVVGHRGAILPKS